MKIYYESYLTHHGIKGQKWGVRRYQNSDGSWTSAGRERYGKGDGRKGKASKTGSKGKSGKAGVGEVELSNVDYAIDMAVSVALAGTYLWYLDRNAKLDADRRLEANYAKRVNDLRDVKKLKQPEDSSESIKKVNPDYPDEGTTMNCVLCTNAMVMRKKGYDVEANKADNGYYPERSYPKLYNGAKTEKPKCKSVDELSQHLASQGEGAYGDVSVSWKGGGGHSIFYEVKGGKTHYYDSQCGQEYTDMAKFNSNIRVKKTQVVRLDNCKPTNFVMAAVSQSTHRKNRNTVNPF